MKNLKNKNGFTLVELLAVIVVLAIVMGIAAVAITNVLENTRKSAFVANAKNFIEGARSMVNADDLNTMLGSTQNNYAPSCNADGNVKYIGLEDIELESGGETSPYGNPYQKAATASGKAYDEENKPATSFIEVKTNVENGKCIYQYSIFLSDGIYAIGSADKPVAQNELTNDDVASAPSGD